MPFADCAFTSPMWGIKLPNLVKSIAPTALGSLRKLGFGDKYAPGEKPDNYILKTSFEENYITGDPEMYEHLEMVNLELDRHWIAGATISWVHEALLETKSLSRLSSPAARCIAFSAGHDPLVDLGAIEQRMNRWPESQYTHLPDARHDILREGPTIRSAVLRNVAEFFKN
jgi:lysophospholipase